MDCDREKKAVMTVIKKRNCVIVSFAGLRSCVEASLMNVVTLMSRKQKGCEGGSSLYVYVVTVVSISMK